MEKSILFFICTLLAIIPIIGYDITSIQSAYSQPNNLNSFHISNISDNIRDSVYPQTESFGNNVYVVWQDNMFGESRLNYDILIKSSIDGGKTFGEVINLSNNTGFSEHPQIAVNGEKVHIVWADNTISNREIYYISSSDGGKTFGEVINLSNNTADSFNQEISVFDNNVYVVWQDSEKHINGNNNISFISSSDGGKTFGEVINLSNSIGKSSFPKIASIENNVYVTWDNVNPDKLDKENNNSANYGIFFTKSTDNGTSFEKTLKLNSEEESGEVQILAEKNNIYVVWGAPSHSANLQTITQLENNSKENSMDGIYFTKSNNSGNEFTKPLFIKSGFQNPLNVEIIGHLGEIIIAIQATPINNTVQGNQDIFLLYSKDDGNTFTESTNISNNSGISECPSMAIVSSDNKLFLVWQDRTFGNNEALSTTIGL